ncbi:MAG: hypothetical protein K0S78_4605, partial [Thermomicrobiales bacterium]|nr:hypothetical protein [Thermomicrobiales bacterium]
MTSQRGRWSRRRVIGAAGGLGLTALANRVPAGRVAAQDDFTLTLE